MKDFKEMILEYGVILGKRYSEKERKTFLLSAKQFFQNLDYAVDITKASFEPLKGANHSVYNMYVGDIKESDVVVVTDYTTSIKTFNLFKQYAFSDKAKHKMMILNLLFLFLFIAIVICFFIIWLFPRIQDDSASKWLISSAIITTLVTLYLM